MRKIGVWIVGPVICYSTAFLILDQPFMQTVAALALFAMGGVLQQVGRHMEWK